MGYQKEQKPQKKEKKGKERKKFIFFYRSYSLPVVLELAGVDATG